MVPCAALLHSWKCDPRSQKRDLGHPKWLEASTADECAVNFFLADECGRIVWLYAAAIEDAHGRGNFSAEQSGHLIADDRVRFDGHFGCGGFAGADGPYGLIGDYDWGRGLRRNPFQGRRNLRSANMLRLAALAFIEHL